MKLFGFIVGLTVSIGFGFLYQTQEKEPVEILGAFSDPFLSLQLATSPVNGYVLSTDGTNNSWVSPTAGSGDGVSNWSYNGTRLTPTTTTAGIVVNGSSTITDLSMTNATATNLSALTSSGLTFRSNNGTQVANFGASGGSNASFSGGVNVTGALGVTGLSTLTQATATSVTVTGNTYFPSGIWNSSGNVGIGTTTPRTRLHVKSSTSNYDGGLTLEDNGDSLATFITQEASKLFFGKGSVTNPTGATSVMVLQDNGNLGIGTTTPTETLEVNGRTKINNILYSGGYINDTNVPIQVVGAAAQFGASRTNGTYGLLFGSYDSTTYAMRAVQSTDKLSFIVNNTNQALNILPSGNVGIGTTTPASNLVVASSTANGTSVLFNIATSSSNLFNVLANGNVGIGVASPSKTLTVNGAMNFSSANTVRGIVGAPTWDTSYISLQNGTLAESSANSAINQSTTGQTIVNSASGQSLNLRIGNSDAILVDSSRRVGIGTSTPDTLLTLTVPDSTNFLNVTNSSASGATQFRAALSGFGVDFSASRSSSGFFTFTTAGTQRMVITATGNVGMATSAPESRLDVWGASSGKILTLFSNAGTKFMEMLNTGVTTLLGAWDFGGATSVEIPNGTAPTVDAIGEMAFDTTDNQLLVATSTNANAPAVFRTNTELYQFSIPSTSPAFATGTLKYFPKKSDGYVVTEVWCGVEGGTNKIINIYGTNLTCTTGNGASTTAPSIKTVGAGSTTVGMTASTTSGVVNWLNVTVIGNWVRE